MFTGAKYNLSQLYKLALILDRSPWNFLAEKSIQKARRTSLTPIVQIRSPQSLDFSKMVPGNSELLQLNFHPFVLIQQDTGVAISAKFLSSQRLKDHCG